MKLALDTNPLYTTTAGMARYVRGLLRGLNRIANEIPGQVKPWAWEVNNLKFDQPLRALRTVYRELIWAPYVAPRRLDREQVDRVHITSHLPLNTGKRPVCQTLADCAILRHPDRFRRWQRWQGPRRLARIAQADRILCISRFTADEAISLLRVPASRLEVVYLGTDFGEESDIVVVPPNFVVPDEFLLFVGSLEPGKNLNLLRDVYAQAAGRGHRLPPLVIIGERWPGVRAEGSAPADWLYAGRQSDGVLRWCYQRARALVFPSRYEGFGLPVLEAMAEGCPVLCAPIASLPEVGGDTVWYASLNAADFGDRLIELLEKDAQRREMAARARARAGQFSWIRCARETLAVYDRLSP